MKIENVNTIVLIIFGIIMCFGMWYQSQAITYNAEAIMLTGEALLVVDNRTIELVEWVNNNFVQRGVSGSGSMKPLLIKELYENLSTLNRKVGPEEELVKGRIYIYNKENDNESILVVHRLVGVYYIGNDTIYVFKGDNNLYVDEPVYREQIIEELVRIDLYE